MTITIDDLFTASGRDAIFNTVIANCNTLALNTTSWVSGGMARTLLLGLCQKVADLTSQLAEINKGGFRETATAKWLIFLSRNMYNVEAIEAAPATGTVTFTNSKPFGYGPFDAGQIQVSNSVTKKTYRSSASATIAASTTTIVAIIADELGTGSNATPGQITQIITPSMPGVTVTNAASLVGTDAESDEALRQRDLDKLGALSPNGTQGAYAYFAKSTKRADGTTIDVNRVKVTSTSGAVTVTVASSTGAVSGAVGTPGTDLYLINQAIQTNAVPVGVTATLQSATTQAIAVTATVYVSTKANKSTSEVQAAVAAKLTALFTATPIGGVVLTPPNGYVFVDAIKGECFRAVADTAGVSYVRDVDVTTPAADTLMGATAVPTLGATTITVTFVSET